MQLHSLLAFPEIPITPQCRKNGHTISSIVPLLILQILLDVFLRLVCICLEARNRGRVPCQGQLTDTLCLPGCLGSFVSSVLTFLFLTVVGP